MADNMKTFGPYLKEKIENSPYNKQDFSDEMGFDHSYIYKIFNGDENPPSAKNLEKMARLLGLPKEQFVIRAGRIPKNIEEIILTAPNELIKLIKECKELNGKEIKKLRQKLR